MSKLLIEQYNDYQVLYEAEGDKRSLFIEGVFLMADIKNRNGRIYPKHVMAKEVNRYMAECVSKKNAFGELNHPPTPQINLDRVSHMIVDLREDGSNYIGKAKILETPMGLIAKSIIEGGGQLAVSSRGTGSVRNIGGVMQVQEDFRLATAADIVSTPSAPAAYVDAIMEAPDWIYNEATGEWYIAEAMRDIHNSKPSQLNEERALAILDKWLKGFSKVKNNLSEAKQIRGTVYDLKPDEIHQYIKKGWTLYMDEGAERLEKDDTDLFGRKITKVIQLTTRSVDRYERKYM